MGEGTEGRRYEGFGVGTCGPADPPCGCPPCCGNELAHGRAGPGPAEPPDGCGAPPGVAFRSSGLGFGV